MHHRNVTPKRKRFPHVSLTFLTFRDIVKARSLPSLARLNLKFSLGRKLKTCVASTCGGRKRNKIELPMANRTKTKTRRARRKRSTMTLMRNSFKFY